LKFSKIIINNSTLNIKTKKLFVGRYLTKSFNEFVVLKFNIIITNKNKTEIVPTEIIIKIKAINSHSNKINRLVANTNDNTNNNIEYIEFNSKIISKELNIKLIKNKKKLSYQNSFQIKRKNGIRTHSIKNYAWI
jgi:16S rRNA C1402 (ribose-2'-O) methylase RsmI